MGIYSRFIFPRVMDRLMSGANFSEIRRRLLRDVHGNILEIGFGTGLNLPHYPDKVACLTGVDTNPGMTRTAARRVADSTIPVRRELLDAQSIPFDNASFDCVVSTWTLCSIQNVEMAIHEVFRVLEPAGRFYFVEHGRSSDRRTAKWQDRLTPFQKIIGGGCRLNRDIGALIRAAGFEILDLENFYMEGVPRVGGFLYLGSAARRL